MHKLKPDIKAKFVDILRTTEVKQGRKLLRTLEDEYCCLGILSDMAVEAGVIPAPVPFEGAGILVDCYVYGDPSDGNVSTLGQEVQEWAFEGGGSSSTSLASYMSGRNLAFDNDNGKTFKEIADIVDAEF